MNKHKAHKKVLRKITRALPCPFCGKVPKFSCRVEEFPSTNGSTGHYATRERCCNVTGTGQVELFFCNDWKKPDYGLWKSMVDRLVDQWNTRV